MPTMSSTAPVKLRLADLVQYLSFAGVVTNPEIDSSIKQIKKEAKALQASVSMLFPNNDLRSWTEADTEVIKRFNTVLDSKYNSLFATVKDKYGVHSIEFKHLVTDARKHRFAVERDRNWNYVVKMTEQQNTNLLNKAYTTLPVTPMGTIMDVAAKLGLIIIPVQYFVGYVKKYAELVDGGYRSDSVRRKNSGLDNVNTSTIDQYNRVLKECGTDASAWVVCPVQMLDVDYLVQNPVYRFYAPPQLSASMTTLRMMAPMLGQMKGQIESLQTIQTQHSEMLSSHERRLGSHDEMIRDIRKTIKDNEEREQQMRVEYQNMLARQQEELNSLRSMSLFDLADPMLILIPNAITDINAYKGTCNVVGCWGPEFSADELSAAGISATFVGQADEANRLVNTIK